MARLLTLFFVVLLYSPAATVTAQETHDHEQHSTQPATELDHDRVECDHDHAAADTNHAIGALDGAEEDDDHDGHAHEAHAEEGHDEEGHDEEGHDEAGHDEAGHDEAGHDEEGHDGESHDEAGHADEGIIVLSAEAMKLADITLATVDRGRIEQSVNLPGEVGFDEDRLVHVAPRFAGIAQKAYYRVGDYVRAGDVVAVIESNESLSPYSIKAIISGWIIKRHVSPGEYVDQENSIYVIADLTNVWVSLAVYPKDANRIKPGLTASVQAIGADTQAEGVIDYVTPVLDVETRSITARVILRNPDHAWRPGTFVEAKITIDPGEEGLVVAKSAVQVLDEEYVLFVPEGEGRFKIVPVEIGDSDAHYTKIFSGVEWGTEYVATGAFELKAKIVTGALGGHAGHGH